MHQLIQYTLAVALRAQNVKVPATREVATSCHKLLYNYPIEAVSQGPLAAPHSSLNRLAVSSRVRGGARSTISTLHQGVEITM